MSNPIGWCDKTWNPITGCSKVSPTCDHCYAERMAHRLAGRFGYPSDDPFRVTFHPDRLDEPLRWRKPRFVFVGSMTDMFRDEVPFRWLFGVWLTMAQHPRHTFLVLTKRPENMRAFIQARIDDGTTWREGITRVPLPNVWLGVTAENQEQADKRIPILLATPAAKRFVSVEPMLGPVDIYDGTPDPRLGAYDHGVCALGEWWEPTDDPQGPPRHGLDWIICGPETGPGRRPMDLDWARSLRDQAQAAGVPFWYKGGLLDDREWKERG